MERFAYVVVIETDTKEHADRVMSSRLDFDEAYYTDANGDWYDEHSAPADATTFDYAIQQWEDLPS